MTTVYTEEQLEIIGTEIAKLLNIKINKKTNRYPTSWGDKSAIGLARCAKRIFLDNAQIDEIVVDTE
jgi:hypothetical protein